MKGTKYRKYLHPLQTDVERLDVKAYPRTPGRRYLVTAARRNTAGEIQAEVTATSEAAAIEKFQSGEVPAIGLGWIVLRVEELD